MQALASGRRPKLHGSHRQGVGEEGLGGLLQQLRKLRLAQEVIPGVLDGILVVDVDGALQSELQVSLHLAKEGKTAKHY